jgi:hypothetical protein
MFSKWSALPLRIVHDSRNKTITIGQLRNAGGITTHVSAYIFDRSPPPILWRCFCLQARSSRPLVLDRSQASHRYIFAKARCFIIWIFFALGLALFGVIAWPSLCTRMAQARWGGVTGINWECKAAGCFRKSLEFSRHRSAGKGARGFDLKNKSPSYILSIEAKLVMDKSI